MAKANTARAAAKTVPGPEAKPSSTNGAESPKVNADNEIEVVEPEAKSPKPIRKSHYPEGTKLFTYQPKGGGEIIEMPMEFEKPDKVWLWELNVQPFLSQTWAWMDRAQVPREVQRQVVSLPDDEYPELFTKWFEAMGGGATPGE